MEDVRAHLSGRLVQLLEREERQEVDAFEELMQLSAEDFLFLWVRRQPLR